MEKLIFAGWHIHPHFTADNEMMLDSLRTFGGESQDAPVYLFAPISDTSTLAADTFSDLNAEVIPYDMPKEARKFPFAALVYAAAAAETHAQGKSELLAWVLPDTLFLQPPTAFELDEDIQFGYRPVHHINIGSAYDQPTKPFWQAIYRHCGVPEDHLFLMETCYRERTRPYFNAGMLVTRPEAGIFRDWLERFNATYQHPDFIPFFEKTKYTIFMHQAVLSGVILAKYLPHQIRELPETYNYPLHLHQDYPEPHKIKSLNELVTARTEGSANLSKWLENLPILPPIDEWLAGKIR